MEPNKILLATDLGNVHIVGFDNRPERFRSSQLDTEQRMFEHAITKKEIKLDDTCYGCYILDAKHYPIKAFLARCTEFLSLDCTLLASRKGKDIEKDLKRYGFKLAEQASKDMDELGEIRSIADKLYGTEEWFPAIRDGQSRLMQALYVACRAVSAYNYQPWRFRIKGDKVQIYLVRTESILSRSNDIVLPITLGSLLENIYQGAIRFGYNTHIRLLSDEMVTGKPIVEIDLAIKKPDTKYDLSPIFERHTNRKHYSDKAMPERLLAAAQKMYSTMTARAFSVADIGRFAEQYSELERIRFSNQTMMFDCRNHFRYAKDENLKERDFLDIRTLESSAINKFILKNFCNPLLRLVLQSAGFIVDHKAKDYQYRLIKDTGTLIIFTEENKNLKNLVRDGTALQSILNMLYKQGLQSQMVISSFDILNVPKKIFSSDELASLASAKESLQQMLREDPRNIIMVLRVGYAEDCEARSLRINPYDLLI